MSQIFDFPKCNYQKNFITNLVPTDANNADCSNAIDILLASIYLLECINNEELHC